MGEQVRLEECGAVEYIPPKQRLKISFVDCNRAIHLRRSGNNEGSTSTRENDLHKISTLSLQGKARCTDQLPLEA